MRNYRVPMVPGPVSVPPEVLAAYAVDYGCADLEEEFFALYGRVENQLRRILLTHSQMAIMTGEGMVALWAGLKSCLRAGDRVLSVATGEFGEGIGDMAHAVGAEVEVVRFAYDAVADPAAVENAIVRFRPKVVTMVHCETLSGTLNPVGEVGQLIAQHDVPLFYVDAVSSAGGAELRTDDWHVDLCLVGGQKCLAVPPGLSIVAVSQRAWRIIAEVAYQGYDALLPWRDALRHQHFPYTPYWHGIAALDVASRRILDEGLDAVLARHRRVAGMCHDGLRELGFKLYPQREEFCSPTVTAVKVPSSLGWSVLDRHLRQRGVVAGGSYGPLAGKVFQLGHMGTQADEALVSQALGAMAEIIHSL